MWGVMLMQDAAEWTRPRVHIGEGLERRPWVPKGLLLLMGPECMVCGG